jgi:hypothetical protein
MKELKVSWLFQLIANEGSTRLMNTSLVAGQEGAHLQTILSPKQANPCFLAHPLNAAFEPAVN